MDSMLKPAATASLHIEPSKREVILALKRLTRRFGSHVAVDAIDLDIVEGEFFTIVGPSGSGKTTLIRMLAGLDEPTSGDILLRGRVITDVPANRRPTAMVFQNLALFDHKSVGENIAFALKMRGQPLEARRARAAELLDLVRLPRTYLDRSVRQCSGGERQRIALARALASDPEILFFDEPLSAIDYQLRRILEVEMKDLHRQTGKTFIYITHSLEEAMVMSDRIAILQAGRIVQAAAPREIYAQPANRFVAGFMGEVNIFAVAPGEHGSLTLPEVPVTVMAPGDRPPEPGYLVVRPERLRLLEHGESADVAFTATILNDYVLGSRTQLHARLRDKTLLVETLSEKSLPPLGQEQRLGFDLADAAFVRE
jgi:spermidine/putrescine transport system ATP-binding protein